MKHILIVILSLAINASLYGQDLIDTIINDKIVLVNIANLSRDEIAKIIIEAEKREAKVVGVDAWFTKVKSDTLLLPTLKTYNNIVLAVKLTECRFHNCDSLTGQYFFYPKEGHVMVSYQSLKYVPELNHNNRIYPFFCLALLQEYDPTIVEKFYKKKIYKRPLHFYGNYQRFITIEGNELLSENNSDEWNFSDKIVILGYLGDKIGLVKNPLTETDYKRSILSNGRLPDMYGVIMLANILTDIMIKTQ